MSIRSFRTKYLIVVMFVSTSLHAQPTVAPVTVAGKSPKSQHLADRTVYPIAETGPGVSLADALRDIPSVDVDPFGGLSLRGSSSVTILVDGQPSQEFKGPNRAQLLQQLPANRYERVEVMTAPSAAYTPEGTAGIINLITRKGRAVPGLTVSASGDTNGGPRAGASGETTLGKVKLTGDLTWQRTPRRSESSTRLRLIDPASGAQASAIEGSSERITDEGVDASVRTVWTPSARDTLTAEAGGYDFTNRAQGDGSYRSSATFGPFDNAYDSRSTHVSDSRGLNGDVDFKRLLAGDDHDFEARAEVAESNTPEDSRLTSVLIRPTPGVAVQDLALDRSLLSAGLTLHYHTHVFGGAKLSVGYDLDYRRDAIRLDETFAGSAVPFAAVHDDFRAHELVSAVFATLDKQAGRFEFLPGLRLESYDRAGEDPALPRDLGAHFFAAYPSLDIKYALDGKDTVTAKYSRRVSRPYLASLDPVRVRSDPLTFSQGNAALRPSYTDSWEADFSRQADKASIDISGFYRISRGEVASLVEDLGGGRLLYTSANVDRESHGGVEVSGADQVAKTLKLTLDLTLQQDAFQGPDVLSGERGGAWLGGKINANWSPTKNDFIQLSVYARSRRPTSQGATSGFNFILVGYRRRISERLSLELEAIDPLGEARWKAFTETPMVSFESENRPRLRAVSLGLTWAFGGGKPKSQTRDFDFSSPR